MEEQRRIRLERLLDEFDRLGIVYTRYVSMMSQEAEVKWVLPLVKPESVEPISAIFEPDEETILNATVPDYVAGILMACIRESFASEVTARRMAMDSAGKNARAMIDDLQLQYNRARQGAITQEITEIVAGAGS
jgi:F-type H+-transporting ATPase subunit gamma